MSPRPGNKPPPPASHVPKAPDMVSDGKRIRPVWRTGDGDGDSSAHLVERSMNVTRGHSTWKLFMDEVELPIERGSPKEPPHYVYLDDRACNAVYSSKAYTHKELREFYPWDFNHQGHIKQGRLNRGNPAYLDYSNTTCAQGPLRGKKKMYTFSGAPDVTDYQPRQKKNKTKMEEIVAKEYEEADPTAPGPPGLGNLNPKEDVSTSNPTTQELISPAVAYTLKRKFVGQAGSDSPKKRRQRSNLAAIPDTPSFSGDGA